MASAIFHKEFNYTPKGRGLSWNVKASPKPQSRPKEVIDAALDAGAAKKVRTSRSQTDKE